MGHFCVFVSNIYECRGEPARGHGTPRFNAAVCTCTYIEQATNIHTYLYVLAARLTPGSFHQAPSWVPWHPGAHHHLQCAPLPPPVHVSSHTHPHSLINVRRMYACTFVNAHRPTLPKLCGKVEHVWMYRRSTPNPVARQAPSSLVPTCTRWERQPALSPARERKYP